MNDENKKQFIIMGVLVLVLGGVLWQFVLKKDPQMAAMANPQATVGAPVTSVFQESSVDLIGLVENIKVVSFDYGRQRDSRNPTLPLVGDTMAFRGGSEKFGSAPNADDLLYEASRKKVTGIIWDELNPLAVIDDEVVTVGHEFENTITVKSIERTEVTLAIVGGDLEVVRKLEEN